MIALVLCLAQEIEIVPTAEKGVYFAEYEGKRERLIVTLHGSRSKAETEVKVWQPYAKKRGFGIVAIQWWLGGDRYLDPHTIYRLLDERLKGTKGHLLHGFSRGSANVPGLAKIDRETKKNLFALFVLNSGAWPEDNPPPYVRDAGDDAFRDQKFVAYFGAKDEEWGEAAARNGRTMRAFIEKRGGTFAKYFELAEGRHATYHQSPEMMNATLDLWLK